MLTARSGRAGGGDGKVTGRGTGRSRDSAVRTFRPATAAVARRRSRRTGHRSRRTDRSGHLLVRERETMMQTTMRRAFGGLLAAGVLGVGIATASSTASPERADAATWMQCMANTWSQAQLAGAFEDTGDTFFAYEYFNGEAWSNANC
jgi:hypothetical protein